MREAQRSALRDGEHEARDGVGLDERPVDLDDSQRVVVDAEADRREGAGVHQAEAVGLVGLESELEGGMVWCRGERRETGEEEGTRTLK